MRKDLNINTSQKKLSKIGKYKNMSVRFIDDKDRNIDEHAESLNSVYYSNQLNP